MRHLLKFDEISALGWIFRVETTWRVLQGNANTQRMTVDEPETLKLETKECSWFLKQTMMIGTLTVCVSIPTLQKTEIECPMLARYAVCTSVGGVHGSVQVALYAASSDTFDPWTVRGPAFAPRHFVWAANDLKFPIFNGFSKTNFLQFRMLSMWNAQDSADFSRCWCGGGTAILHICYAFSFHFCGCGVRQRKLTENSQQSWTPSIETLDWWCEPSTRVIFDIL